MVEMMQVNPLPPRACRRYVVLGTIEFDVREGDFCVLQPGLQVLGRVNPLIGGEATGGWRRVLVGTGHLPLAFSRLGVRGRRTGGALT